MIKFILFFIFVFNFTLSAKNIYTFNVKYNFKKNILLVDEIIYLKNNLLKDVFNFLLYSEKVFPNSIDIISIKNIDTSQKLFFQKNKSILSVFPLKNNSLKKLKITFKLKIKKYKASKSLLANQLFEQLLLLFSNEKNPDYGIISSNENIVSLVNFFPLLIELDKKYTEIINKSNLGDIDINQKNDYNIYIKLNKKYKIISNLDIINKKKYDNNILYFFKGENLKNLGLFILKKPQKYGEYKIQSNKTEICFIYNKENTISAKYYIKTIKNAFNYYNNIYCNYDDKKITILQAPLINGAGGMEISKMILLADMLFLPDKEKNDFFDFYLSQLRYDKQWLISCDFAIAHELAHEWWYHIIGSNSIFSPFLDEGMASFSAMKYIKKNYLNKDVNAFHYFNITLPYILSNIFCPATSVINLSINKYKGILNYYAVIYGGAVLFFEDLNKTIPNFEIFLKEFSKKYKHSSYDINILKKELNKFYPEKEKLNKIFDIYFSNSNKKYNKINWRTFFYYLKIILNSKY